MSVALSALHSRPISIQNIRANRTPPGLKNQHAAGLRLVAEICAARLEGCDTRSTSVVIHPQSHPQCSKTYVADPGTAGSIALLLQVSLPCLLWSSPIANLSSSSAAPCASTILDFRGGTNASNAPPIEHTQHVLLPFLRTHFRVDATLQILKRGYYPKGGGTVRITVPPFPASSPIPAVALTARGHLTAIHGISFVAGLPKSVAQTMCTAAAGALVHAGVAPEGIIQIKVVRYDPSEAFASGSGVFLWAETDAGCVLSGSALGRRGIDASNVGQDAARELASNLAHGGCVDEHMQDQMIIFLALAQGKSRVRTGPLTLHTRTAIWVAEQLTDAKFQVHEGETDAIIECDGAGYVSSVFAVPTYDHLSPRIS